MEVTKIRSVGYVNGTTMEIVPKHKATHMMIECNNGGRGATIYISVDCENFCLFKEAICNDVQR